MVAFAANGISALVVRERRAPGETADLNMRSALLHLASDAVASLGVALAGAVMLATGGWSRLDPAVSLLIGVSIAWHAWKLLKASNAVLLEGTPDGVDPDEILAAMAAVDGVETAHDLHVWAISSEVRALSAHVVVEGHPSLEDAQVVAGRVRRGDGGPVPDSARDDRTRMRDVRGHRTPCDMDLVDPSEMTARGHYH